MNSLLNLQNLASDSASPNRLPRLLTHPKFEKLVPRLWHLLDGNHIHL